MAYISVEDFRAGIDRRRSRVNGPAGSLWTLKNAHITRGGEIERAKKFVSKHSLPAGTFGMGEVNDQLFVFGSEADPGVPGGVTYQRLQHSDMSTAMTRVLDVEAFDGQLYVIAEFADGSIFHYYDGSRVTSWDAIASDVADNDAVASALASKIDEDSAYTATSASNVVTITAAEAGTAYTISKSTENRGTTDDQDISLNETQANQAAVSEVVATASFRINGGTSNPGTNKISSVKIDGVEILNSAVDWDTSNSNTASDVADQIDTFNSTPEYTADNDGDKVVISAAAGTGSGPNGFVLEVTADGDVSTANLEDMAGGVDAQSAQAQITEATISGTFEGNDLFTITIDAKDFQVSGDASGTGDTVLTFGSKLYSTVSSLLYFCALNDARTWGSGIGAGFINMANQSRGNEELKVAVEYQGRMAVFGRRNVRIWQIFEDQENNTFVETVPNTGTNSPQSVVPYGNLDVFYLSDSGVRSLRPRDINNAANVEDVGTAIDPFLLGYLGTLTDTQVARAVATFEPVDGRYWLAVGERIFVFSFFPGNKITAWSYYEPGFEVEAFAQVGKQVYARAGDTIYLYGGDDADTYPDDDEQVVTVEFPFLDAEDPATWKAFNGFDVALQGQWDVRLYVDPERDDAYIDVGTLDRITYSLARVGAPVQATHIAPWFQCSSAGLAKIGSLAIHYSDKYEGG